MFRRVALDRNVHGGTQLSKSLTHYVGKSIFNVEKQPK